MSGLTREVVRAALAGEFDVIHCHADHWAFAISSLTGVPVLHTMHGRMDDPDHRPVYSRCDECCLVSISDSQRSPVPGATWVATVYHGLPLELFSFRAKADEPAFALFLGRISPEKRPDLAIDVARRAGIPLKIAAKVDPKDRDYYERDIAPRIRECSGVEYLGEVDDARKADLLGRAQALLFPIDWPEPFGLVAIEALACGTPVVTRPCGALPELIEDGVTGFLRTDLEELAGALVRSAELDRRRCRETFERRFSRERMVADYERLYAALMTETAARRPGLRLAA